MDKGCKCNGNGTQSGQNLRATVALQRVISWQLGGDPANAEDAKRILSSALRIDTPNAPDLAAEQGVAFKAWEGEA